ncbi:WecB/TagA/CpsF family glycosyltransferase [Pedomonas mirosovicensis]|uniref:WecB/TagA/CpsF family glycosyltransferase n=1 Tax=Pedomonas mirosovicensis TaxID=2908641 RepID=UPI0021676D0A|nr:WecB/TagA/CpsF family glycosyltransferase [Pedomonas mirosovicensis]MCH8684179.1 WecB/TagA/CpsF family glycosyltransferase [Pedomonas mirosovicensis]
MNIRVGAEVSVGGIAIQGFRSLDEAVEFVISADGQVTPGFAIAINPEKVIRYQGDSALRKAVSDATLRYPDGIGVTLAMRAKGVHTTRVAGVDLWERLMRCAAQTGTPVYLLGGAPGVVGQVSRRAIAEMPGLVIAGTQHGYFENEDAVLDDICQSDAKILFVAMGSPKQEVFIHKVRQRRPDCFCMGVGGGRLMYSSAGFNARL